LPVSSLRLQKLSFRFAEQVLNSKLSVKEEIEGVLLDTISDLATLSRPVFNNLLEDRFVADGWNTSTDCIRRPERSGSEDGFLKERIGIEMGFGHASER
jgi:hypothetical protein